MCFDDTILSAYFDDELEETWKKKVEEHLSSCPLCSAKVASFRNVRTILHTYKTPDYTFQKEVVLERIHHSISSEKELGFWYRKIYLSKTAVAVAAVSLVLVGLSLFFFSTRRTGPAAVAEVVPVITSSKTDVLTADSMNSVIRYLNSQDKTVEITIDLPLGHTFQYLGEPQFLKEADYVRGR